MQDHLPKFLYGTAWKEEQTELLTLAAIESGFRGIDTANQRRHYFEEGVGAAITHAILDGIIARDDLFVQTKFTYRDGQDHRLPYDANAPLATQVAQSFGSSLEHLKIDWIDSYVLHGPSQSRGLSQDDHDVWRAMEDILASGKVRFLGVSNISLAQLKALYEFAEVKPSFVQNRCYARTGWDRDVRIFCRDHGITYQGFSLLTANVRELQNAAFETIVERTERTPAQVVFRFARQVGMLPLTGTTDRKHMREDLAIEDFELTNEEVDRIERIAG